MPSQNSVCTTKRTPLTLMPGANIKKGEKAAQQLLMKLQS
jgi:hypothetical protein